MNTVHPIDPERPIRLSDVDRMLNDPFSLELDPKAREKIRSCREWLENHLETAEHPVYGVNTGFGSLCDTRIEANALTELQENLIRSHAVGMGEAMPPEVSRLMLWFKLHALSKGYSGIRTETAEALLHLFNSGAAPVVYEFGSLGASGDLAPLAHLVLPLIGEGQLWTENEGAVDASDWWSAQIDRNFRLGSKEGLALLNGTQFMSAIGALALLRSYRISYWADLIACISIDAFDARPEPFDERLQMLRKQPGQAFVAERIRGTLSDSPGFHSAKGHVQDPYSFRCIPQVHGAGFQTLQYVQGVVEREIDSVTDNPTIFPGEDVLSGGNFHGQAIALALDQLALAISEWGNISERRVYQLISGTRGLPSFLTADPGLHSGLMIPQYTAASIASKNKFLAMPASVDSIPSSQNQEDHVSMGANAATRLLPLIDNVEQILAIELLSATQALHLSGRKTSPFLSALIDQYREQVPVIEGDRIFHHDLQKSWAFIRETEVDGDLLGY